MRVMHAMWAVFHVCRWRNGSGSVDATGQVSLTLFSFSTGQPLIQLSGHVNCSCSSSNDASLCDPTIIWTGSEHAWVGAGAGQLNDLEVFLIPHYHADPQWLETFQYYFEYNITTILDNIFAKDTLLSYPARRFIVADIVNFGTWFERQNASVVERVHNIIARGQFEFVGGCWCMSDEASTFYADNIRQCSFAHEKLLAWGLPRPTIAWHIDVFSHNPVTSTMFALAGYDAFVGNRVPYFIKEEWMATKSLEYVWQGSRTLPPNRSSLFVHIFDDHYGSPDILMWESPDGGAIGPAPEVTPATVEGIADALAAILWARASYFQHKLLLFPFGDDWTFQLSDRMFSNMDLLLGYIADHWDKYRLRIHYSLPSDYFRALNELSSKQAIKYPLLTDTDLFAYIGSGGWDPLHPYDNDGFWSGAYTQAPALKLLSRQTNAITTTSELFTTLAWSLSHKGTAPVGKHVDWDQIISDLDLAQRNASMQADHGTLTGCLATAVYENAMQNLNASIDLCAMALYDIIPVLLAKSTKVAAPIIPLVFIKNEDDFVDLSQLKTVGVVITNSLGWESRQAIRVRIGLLSWETTVAVLDSQGNPILAQLTGITSNNTYAVVEMMFMLYLSPVSLTTVFIAAGTFDAGLTSTTTVQEPASDEDIVISNEFMNLTFCAESGHQLCSATSVLTGEALLLVQEFVHYNDSNTPSDSFHFKPQPLPPRPFATSPKVLVHRGELAEYVTLLWEQDDDESSFVEQTIVLYSGEGGPGHSFPFSFEIRLRVGPICQDCELAMRFNTTIANGAELFTDDNGWMSIKHLRNDTFPEGLAFARNVYPHSATSFIRDSKLQLTLTSAHGMGVRSAAPGSLEAFLHRRPMRGFFPDDSSSVFMLLRVALNDVATEADSKPLRAHAMNAPPQIACAPGFDYGKWTRAGLVTTFSALAQSLPLNIHLLAFRQFTHGQILQLSHIYDLHDSPSRSTPAGIDLSQMFAPPFSLANVSEVQLTALGRPQSKRPIWNTTVAMASNEDTVDHMSALDPSVIVILPLDLRAYLATLSP